eukprot:643876-Hanusia_phi.AAC.1
MSMSVSLSTQLRSKSLARLLTCTSSTLCSASRSSLGHANASSASLDSAPSLSRAFASASSDLASSKFLIVFIASFTRSICGANRSARASSS